jgi:DNA-binding IclR family transcriptional regulator
VGRLEPKKSKSAARALELFEYFNERRPEATVMEIAREYGYPQSSTSELVNCLVQMGFLRRVRRGRSYRPTARVAMLGSWVHPRLFRHGKLFRLMDELSEQVEAPVALSGLVGLRVCQFHVVGVAEERSSELEPYGASLLRSAMGKLLLSTFDRSHICKLTHRLNADASAQNRIRAEDLIADIEQVRRDGFASSTALVKGDAGVCAILLPQHAADEPLALGVGVAQCDPRGVDFYVKAIRNAVASHLGPVLAHTRTDAPLARAL